jgi:hypothetical protein
LNAKPTEAGYGKAGKQKPLSNFSTATTTTKYIELWDTDSEGKANPPNLQSIFLADEVQVRLVFAMFY